MREKVGGGRMTRNDAVEITGNCTGIGFGVANALKKQGKKARG
jgi:NADP-dependent 3-hydroxy acid dehydrogenase YdfG